MTTTIEVDTLIIGAGVIGSAAAWKLAEALGSAEGQIRVIDFDMEGSLSSSELNAGGVRATFAQPLNITMSKLTIDYFAEVAEQVGYRDCGYLWLHTPASLPGALKAREVQTARGWEVQAWDVAELKRRIPFLDKTDDLAGAVFAPKDGLVNPNRVKNHFREKARALGVAFDDRVWLRSSELSAGGYSLRAQKYPVQISSERKLLIVSEKDVSEDTVPVVYKAKRVINCAGPWAGEVARILGYSSPVHPVRRQICLFDCRDVDLTPYGMFVDTSGVYFHPEATNGLAGYANHDEPQGVNFEYDGENFFMERIWPALYERSSAFEKLKHVTGWAGLYEVSPDESAILGEAQGVPTGRVFEAHSFSGHGVMHSYAAGIAIAELMTRGRFETVDASILSPARFARGELVREQLVI